MRREGVGIIEVLIALGLGVALVTFGVRFLSGAGHQAVASTTGAENLGLANELADVFRKRLGEYEVVDIAPGATSTEFTAIAVPPAWGAGGEAAGFSGGELTVQFSPSSASWLDSLTPGQYAYLSLPQQKLVLVATVSSVDSNGYRASFALPPSCAPRGVQIRGSQVFVKDAIALTVRALPSPPFLTVQGGLRFDEGANALNLSDLKVGLSFKYVFLTQNGGQFTLDELRSYPTTQQTSSNGQTGFLSRIAILSEVGQQSTQSQASTSLTSSTLVSIPVRPLVTSCALPPAPGATSGLTVVVSGPYEGDPFFSLVYRSAPIDQKAVVTIGGDRKIIDRAGVHNYQVRIEDEVSLRASPLTAREDLPSGRRISYTFTPDPASVSFPSGSLSPLFPNSASVIYRLTPGNVKITLSNFSPGGTWGVGFSPVGGSYAERNSFLGQTSSEALLEIRPGVYDLFISTVSLQKQATISGKTVTYTASYPTSPSSQRVVVNSGETVEVSARVDYSSPIMGTLIISRDRTNFVANFKIYNEEGALLQRVRIDRFTSTYSIQLPPGGYRIVAESAQAVGGWYDPVPEEEVVGVSSNERRGVGFTYRLRPSTIKIDMRGLPEGEALIYVYRNGTQVATLRGSGTISVDNNGDVYEISPQEVTYMGRRYRGEASISRLLPNAGGYTYTVNVTYTPATFLRIIFQNSTPCGNGAVLLYLNRTRIMGPYSSDTTLDNPPQGTYELRRATNPEPSPYFECYHDFSPSYLNLSYSGPEDTFTFTVRVKTDKGGLRVTLNGYPYSSLQGGLTVRSPSGQTIAPSSTSPVSGGLQVVYGNITPGTYSVSLSPISVPSSGMNYVPNLTSASPSVQAGQVTDLAVSYTAQPPPGSGILDLNVSCSGSGCSYFNPLVCVFRGDYRNIPDLNGNAPLLACPTRAAP